MRSKLATLAITAAFGLAFTLTSSCSSDDGNDPVGSSSSGGGSYPSCTEAEVIYNDCSEQYYQGFMELYPSCIATCGMEDEVCLDGCMTPVLFECLDSKGFCGSNSIIDNDACEEHYISECDFIEED